MVQKLHNIKRLRLDTKRQMSFNYLIFACQGRIPSHGRTKQLKEAAALVTKQLKFLFCLRRVGESDFK